MLGWWWPPEINKTMWASELCLYVAKHFTYPKSESQFFSKENKLMEKVIWSFMSALHFMRLKVP